MKKRIVISFITLLTLCSVILLKAPQRVLGSTIDQTLLDMITYEALRYVGGEKTISKIEPLYDFDNNNEYYLVEYEDKGYMIYSTITNEYIEYNFNATSPYLGIDGVKCYMGPASYAYITSEGQFYTIGENRILSQIEVENYQTCYDNLKTRALSTLSMSTMQSFPSPSDYQPFWVEYPEFFRNLEYITYNVDKLDPYVAIAMVLLYYDTYYNDHFVPEEFEVKGNIESHHTSVKQASAMPGFRNELTYLLVYLKTGDQITLPVSTKYQLNYAGMTSTFHSYFTYLKNNYEETPKPYDIVAATNNSAFIGACNFIYEGRPVIGTLSDVATTQGNHQVVLYGYQNDGLIGHFGWSWQENAKEVNIKEYTLTETVMLRYQHNSADNHVHSDNFAYLKTHETLCSCGYRQASHDENYSYRILANAGDKYHMYHLFSCYCTGGIESLENHKFDYSLPTSTTHTVTCPCGYTSVNAHDYQAGYQYKDVLTHYRLCGCGESTITMHNYQYAYSNPTYRVTRCSCGNERYIPHSYELVGNQYICQSCGFVGMGISLDISLPWL